MAKNASFGNPDILFFFINNREIFLLIRKSTSRCRAHRRPIFEKSIYKRKIVSTSLSTEKPPKNLHVNFLDEFFGA